MNGPRERKHRLDPAVYRGQATVSLTACIQDRTAIFVSDVPTQRFAQILDEECERKGVDVLLACFMPDHLHAMLRGQSDDSDLIRAFDRFKLRTSVLLDRYHRPVAWQKNYFDHVIRFDESWQRQASYIALNPVRSGLVEDPFEYPHIFSSLGPPREVLSQIFWDGGR